MSDDRFQSVRPVFQPSTNAAAIEATTPKVNDHTPSQSMSERLRDQGQDYLASLLEKSRQLASTMELATSPAKKRKTATTETTVSKSTAITIQAEDIVSDEEFIKRTRGYIRMQREHSGSTEIVSMYQGYDMHSQEARRLFMANGGEKYLTPGTEFATAFDLLRAEKLRALTKPIGERIIQPMKIVPLPGTPKQREWKARAEAEKVQQERQALGFSDEQS